jgi:hypothetical protein
MVRDHLILTAGYLTKLFTHGEGSPNINCRIKMCGRPSTVNWNNSSHCPACCHVKQSICNIMHKAISKMSPYLRKSRQYEASHCTVLTALHLSPTFSLAHHSTGPQTIISLCTATEFQAHIKQKAKIILQNTSVLVNSI